MGTPQQAVSWLEQEPSGLDTAAPEMSDLQPFTYLLKTKCSRGSDWLSLGHMPTGCTGEGEGGSSPLGVEVVKSLHQGFSTKTRGRKSTQSEG